MSLKILAKTKDSLVFGRSVLDRLKHGLIQIVTPSKGESEYDLYAEAIAHESKGVLNIIDTPEAFQRLGCVASRAVAVLQFKSNTDIALGDAVVIDGIRFVAINPDNGDMAPKGDVGIPVYDFVNALAAAINTRPVLKLNAVVANGNLQLINIKEGSEGNTRSVSLVKRSVEESVTQFKSGSYGGSTKVFRHIFTVSKEDKDRGFIALSPCLPVSDMITIHTLVDGVCTPSAVRVWVDTLVIRIDLSSLSINTKVLITAH
jgi:hypothetical protein